MSERLGGGDTATEFVKIFGGVGGHAAGTAGGFRLQLGKGPTKRLTMAFAQGRRRRDMKRTPLDRRHDDRTSRGGVPFNFVGNALQHDIQAGLGVDEREDRVFGLEQR